MSKHRRTQQPEAQDLSRQSAVEHYSAARKRRSLHKRIRVAVIIVLCVILTGGGIAWAYLSNIENRLHEGVNDKLRGTLTNVQADDPFYMLLLGVDKSEQRAESAEYGQDSSNYRTDSIMLARIDPKQKQVTLVSIHRDTLVDLGEHGKQKINAAYSVGGPSYTVEVISKFAGVPISHYAEIDFDHFEGIVDALGGVTVDVPIDINDPYAGEPIQKGEQTLNGAQALTLCRSRHAYDNYGDGDLYRAANQRMVISAIGKKILSSDPATMAATIEALSKYVTTDMGVMDIISLATNLRGMNMETDFYTAVEPTTSEYSNEVWWEILNKDEWKKMMDRINQGLPPTEEDVVDEATGIVIASAGGGAMSSDEGNTARSRAKRSGTVSVRNGCGVAGVGAEAAEAITELGYKTEAGNANHSDYAETVVVYGKDDQKQDAQEIVDLLGKGRIVKNNNEYIYSSDFLVVIGKDWVQ